jgi:hypothetical protein
MGKNVFQAHVSYELVADEFQYIADFPALHGQRLGALNLVDLEEISIRTLIDFLELPAKNVTVEFLGLDELQVAK